MPVVEAEALSRSFGSFKAVDGLDFQVERGEVFGLLGPNGAGKTTTIRMLTTLLAPSSGSARVCGFDVTKQPGEIRRRIGHVMQLVAWRGLLTGRECVEIEAALFHLPPRLCRQRAEEVLDLVGMLPHADKIWTAYSGGMKKRLDLACGLIHHPEVLVLDEPSLGLDVQSRHRMADYVRRLAGEGVTVLLATNYLDEADRMCDRLSIIDHGREVAAGTPEELKRSVGADVIQVTTEAAERLQEAVRGLPWVRKILQSHEGETHIYVEDASLALPVVMRLCLENDIPSERISYSQPTLDDVFLMHTGRELREDSEEAA
jgi:ABC-2 type transport system ATP-binding protein